MKILGIDPGKKGAVVILEGSKIKIQNFTTENDVVQFIDEEKPEFAFLEDVHSFPGQGNVSVWSFGSNWGLYKGALLALKIPFELVSPMRWQRFMRCLSGGDKNITKSKAQQLYPSLKITHANADALLIATYGKLVKDKDVNIFD